MTRVIEPEWLSVEQAALFLGVHRQTIQRYLRIGVIQSIRITPKGRHRIHRDELNNLLKPKKGN